MRNKLKLVINNKFIKKEKFFIKKELQTILNLYARKVSSGDWKDYGLSINKKEITFDIYQRASETPIYRISKCLNPKKKTEKFYVLDGAGRIIKKSENLMRTIDSLNIRFNNKAITWGIVKKTNNWTMNRNLLSRVSTTDIKNIPIIVI